MEQASHLISDPAAASALLEKILSCKCKIHRQFFYEFVYIKPSQFQSRVCVKCIEVRNIPMKELISIRLLLEATSNTMFNAYPIFTDNLVTQTIQRFENTKDKISADLSSFFQNLNSAVSRAIERSKYAQEEKLSFLSTSQSNILDSLEQISQIKKFQDLVKNANENEEELKRFIDQQYANAHNNTQAISNKLFEYFKIYESFSLNDPNNKLEQIVQIIDSIEFFPTILQNQANNQQYYQNQQQYPPQQQSLLLQQPHIQQPSQNRNLQRQPQQQEQSQHNLQLFSISNLNYTQFLNLYNKCEQKIKHEQRQLLQRWSLLQLQSWLMQLYEDERSWQSLSEQEKQQKISSLQELLKELE